MGVGVEVEVVEVVEVVAAVVVVAVLLQHENNMPEDSLDNNENDKLLDNVAVLVVVVEEVAAVVVVVVVVEGVEEEEQRLEDSRLSDIARYIVLHIQEGRLIVDILDALLKARSHHLSHNSNIIFVLKTVLLWHCAELSVCQINRLTHKALNPKRLKKLACFAKLIH